MTQVISMFTFTPLLLAAAAVAGPAGGNAGETKPTEKVFDEAGYTRIVAPFLANHCQPCHGSGKVKGQFRLSSDLGHDFADAAAAERWRTVAGLLSGQEMPPRDRPRPDDKQLAAVVDWITQQTARAELVRGDARITLRRLNRDEYRATLRDLTGVDPDIAGLPLDPPTGGTSKNARTLVISPLHLELYAETARTVVDRALVQGARPKSITWRFQPEEGDGDEHRITLPDGQRPIVQAGQNRKEGGFTIMHHDEWDRVAVAREMRVPRAGDYVIRVRAAGVLPSRQQVVVAAERELKKRREQVDKENPGAAFYNKQQYEQDLLHFRTDRIYDYGPPRLRLLQLLGAQSKVVAEFDVDAGLDAPKVYEFRTRFTTEQLSVVAQYDYKIPRVLENWWFQTHDDFPRPEVRLDWIELEGPVYDAWPPSTHTRLMLPRTAADKDDHAYARRVLESFMARAYRRPVTPGEVEAKLALVDTRKGAPLVEAIKPALVAVLTSPFFLFIDAPAPQATPGNHLDDFQLASRLSYFLWSSMPDARLFELARQGKLHQPATLVSETQRLLADPRARALADHFAAEWLGLNEVGANPPAPLLYPQYDRHLELSIVGEAKGFFREMLDGNHGVLEFLRSNFVVINERLGRFYGIPGVKGDQFRVVALPADVKRGGLLTQASMLSITSNGTRTSPVKRGVWVLKNILGQDPGLPLANAGEIGSKVPGIDKATVRMRLEAHRRNPQCARCHTKIDPLGLALENFNAAGEWRDQEAFGYEGRTQPEDPRIDASARLADGTSVSGVAGLSAQLLKQGDQFRRCLAGKLLTYALGRELGLTDQPLVAAASGHLKKNGDTLRALITYIVTSPAFGDR
jgi:mono/diheme cytochrome c family protein